MQLSSYATPEIVSKRFLDSGASVLIQHVPATYSVVLGVWIRVGSRDEAERVAGISHFVEHMVFKGTQGRSAFEIAHALERVGGSIEAHTTKEYTCFYTRVLREHLDLAFDVLSDLVLHPKLRSEDVKLEQGVVVEEINNVFDTPDDWIFEILAHKIYGTHPMSRPILGSRETVLGLSQSDLQEFMAQHYVGGNVVLAVAGDIDVDSVYRRIERQFTFVPGGTEHATAALPQAGGGIHFEVDDKLTQQYLALACPTMSYEDPDRYAYLLTSCLMGGGMSSRLFQSVRENAGLCYAVHGFSEFARDTGMGGTFLAVSPENTRAALELVWLEYEKLRREGISKRELDDTRDQLKGSMLLGMEGAASKMSRMAKNEMYYGRQIGVQEIVGKLDAITVDDVIGMAERFYKRDDCLVVGLGPLAQP